MSEDNYEGLTISLKGHYRMINNEKQELISEFVKDIEDILSGEWSYDMLLTDTKKKWEEKLK